MVCRFLSYSTYRLAIEIDFAGAPVSDRVTGTDPGYASSEYAVPTLQADFEPVWSHPLDASPAAEFSAATINKIARAAHMVLDCHPAVENRRSAGRLPINYVLMRDFGVGLPPVPSFLDRWGLRSKYFHDLPVELGLARYLDMAEEAANCASVTRGAFAEAGARLLRDLGRYDFVAFHVKGPDEPGHDGDWRGKVAAIETVDEGLFSLLAPPVAAGQIILVVTSDHATCWRAGTHTADPVPIIIGGVAANGSRPTRFTERDCGLVHEAPQQAWTLMSWLMGHSEGP